MMNVDEVLGVNRQRRVVTAEVEEGEGDMAMLRRGVVTVAAISSFKSSGAPLHMKERTSRARFWISGGGMGS